jgi:homoserine O-acetyltransferase
VQRQYAHFDEPCSPKRCHLSPFTVAYETYGTLNPARSNGHPDLAMRCPAMHMSPGIHPPTRTKNRAGGMKRRAGKIFDTDHFFVICPNVIGGCQGSTGAVLACADGKPYALRFPNITISDMVQAQRHLLDYLGIDKLFAVAGGSMGGMQAHQWGVETPERVGAVIFLAAHLVRQLSKSP